MTRTANQIFENCNRTQSKGTITRNIRIKQKPNSQKSNIYRNTMTKMMEGEMEARGKKKKGEKEKPL